MERRRSIITYKRNPKIRIGIIPGHFATSHSHINFYIDFDNVKRDYKMAKETANTIAEDFRNTPVDTVVCLEGTEFLAAYLAENLSENPSSLNSGNDICLITPEIKTGNQFMFRDNTQSMIWQKNVLLMISSASTGRTIQHIAECLRYYNGRLAGVSALFSAIDAIVINKEEIPVKSIIHVDDLPGKYISQNPVDCVLCKERVKIDAMINEHGYSKL
jgi:orotate phosphoribosyltransferase